MEITLGLPERPFSAIKKGTKKAEGRVQTLPTDQYGELQPGDTIHFFNEDSGEKMDVTVTYLHHYRDPREMLETEGKENMLSGGGTIEEGVKVYNSFTDYEKNIPIHGIYAIGVEPIK